MPGKLSTLHELCLQRTARLLKTSYWNPELPLSHNPFASLPSILVDTLINYVCRISTSEPLLSSDLRLLLKSGRVRQFILDKDENDKYRIVHASDLSLQEILMDLLPFCSHLITVKIYFKWFRTVNSPMVTGALNRLLREAKNVKHVESFLEFDLRVLCHSFQLEKLVLHFSLRNRIYDFLEVDGQFKSHTSLKHLEVYKNDPFSYLDVGVVLKYCTELNYTNLDISKSLEHLHAEELHDGSLMHKYKIQKCFLGFCDDYGVNFTVASSCDGVRLVALTCPYLQELTIVVDKDDLLSLLSDFHGLTVFNIHSKSNPYREFSASLLSVLEKPYIGSNLKNLELARFANVDFTLIGLCCPNLEVLKVFYISEVSREEYVPTSFRKLQMLSMLNRWGNCKNDTLVGILSNATDLRQLVIRGARELTDHVLEDVLKKNSLSKLKKLSVAEPGLSLHGWQNVARSLTALEYLDVCDANFCFEKCLDAIREINPRITVHMDFD